MSRRSIHVIGIIGAALLMSSVAFGQKGDGAGKADTAGGPGKIVGASTPMSPFARPFGSPSGRTVYGRPPSMVELPPEKRAPRRPAPSTASAPSDVSPARPQHKKDDIPPNWGPDPIQYDGFAQDPPGRLPVDDIKRPDTKKPPKLPPIPADPIPEPTNDPRPPKLPPLPADFDPAAEQDPTLIKQEPARFPSNWGPDPIEPAPAANQKPAPTTKSKRGKG